ncbi:protein phosphatase CheZ [Rhodospirillaceae bacterium KN72]|uniref:Protein phosphatase CheZ n=1 Tax=Pacificispira spongiicola TaxID=2729598 RepID=A0A7Y0E0H5_9PROT|nr:chemotaxis protein [Pacificispira spongiicola]NMM44954.1 protein phosphatase CheZ [Pacificispira spongiicola]
MSSFRSSRPFRIERLSGAPEPSNPRPATRKAPVAPSPSADLAELRSAIEAMHADIRALKGGDGSAAAPPPVSGVDPEVFRQQIVEAERLKADLQELSDAIERTKQEIASLRSADRGSDKLASASEALRAVVGDTETATDGIINAAEAIEEVAGRLRAQVSGDEALGMIDDLFEHSTGIFEHCNFQDITGQRITKVVNTMEFIDERVRKMMEIWGGDNAFAGVVGTEQALPAHGEELHGPAMDGDASIGQDEIDALFD